MDSSDSSDSSSPSPTPDRTRALIVALELLRTKVADLKGSIADNAFRFSNIDSVSKSGANESRRNASYADAADMLRQFQADPRQRQLDEIAERRKREAEDAILAREKSGGTRQMQGSGAIEMLAQKFGAVIGPLQIFSQILQSNASGFQILSSAVQLLAATLAPILLPIVIALAGALLDLQQEIQGELLSGLREWSRLIFGTLLPILNELVLMFRGVIDTLADFMLAMGNAAADAAEWFQDKIDAVDEVINAGKDAAVVVGKTGDGDFSGAAGAGGSFDGPAVAPAAAGGVAAGGAGAAGGRRGVDDALASFRASFGAKASYTGLADVGRQAQLAGLQGDPIQKRMVDLLARIADGVEGGRADARRGRPPEAPFPRGG